MPKMTQEWTHHLTTAPAPHWQVRQRRSIARYIHKEGFHQPKIDMKIVIPLTLAASASAFSQTASVTKSSAAFVQKSGTYTRRRILSILRK